MHPLFSILLIGLSFIGFSHLIFTKAPFPQYTFGLTALGIITLLSNKKRIIFLKQCFAEKEFAILRIFENLMSALPFAIYLFIQGNWLIGLVVFLGAFLLTRIPNWFQLTTTIPSPFSQFPFEFTRGFRRLFFFYILAYVIVYFALKSENFNLSIFALLATFFINALFYSSPEPFYYVWIHKHTPKQFIFHKLRIVLTYALFPSIPIVTAMLYGFPEKCLEILLLPIIGLLYVILFMLSKYTSYPHELSITHSFIVAGCVFFPPFMLIVIPIFYVQSIKNLRKHLYD